MSTKNRNQLAGRWALLGLILAIFSTGAAAARAQTEEGIKAAFIYNFAKFVQWPETAFSAPSAPFTVGFVGGPALADCFEQNTKGKNANGRDFAVKKFSAAAGLDGCQIVYVADPAQVGPVTAALKGKPALVVGDPETLLDAGGMIRFVRDGARVLFDVNRSTVTAAGLTVDAKLLKAARSVKGG